MRIIICGVGRVGLSIASYLSMHNDDITIVDSDPQLVKRVSDTYDIKGVVGYASQPDILESAGANEADVIIAVTDCDEVNMVACQVAHSVFGVNKKIARIRNKEYRNAEWSNLFSRNHMPIDVIISPEEAIADAILNRMSVPGTTNDISLLDQTVHLAGFLIDHGNPSIGNSLKDLHLTNKDIDFDIFLLLRDASPIEFDQNTKLQARDELYFICKKKDLLPLLESLGNQNDIYNGNIVLSGGGVIGEAVATKIIENDNFKKNKLIIIENNLHRGHALNSKVKNALVIHGSALDYDILKEAGTDTASLFISVMNSNENNILSAVLAKKMGTHYSIALNNNKIYSQLIPDHLIDAIVNPEVITVSGVLHNLRRGYIRSINTIRHTGVEIIEAEVSNECSIATIPVRDMNLPENIKILGVFSSEKQEFSLIKDDTVIKSKDYVIVVSYGAAVEEVEKLFSFSISLF